MTMIDIAPKAITMSEIKIKAKALGIDGSKMKKKTELVHAIQKAEGCTPCYGRSTGSCPWTQCCWRSDCFRTKA
jgi:hypothetical protein